MNASATSSLLDVVIVTFKSEKVVDGALSKLPEWAEVVVVDNASGDRVAERVAEHGRRFVALERNYGFGTACNRGARFGCAPYILFLNPDAEISPEALLQLMKQLKDNDSWGAISPQIIDESGAEFFRDGSFLNGTELPCIKPEKFGAVTMLSGSVVLVKREVFCAIGGFDEAIFLFYEDDDLFYRIRQLGYLLISDRQVKATHLHGKSSTPSFSLEWFKAYHAERSRKYVARKFKLALSSWTFRLKIAFRLIKAILTFDGTRIARNFGKLQASIET